MDVFALQASISLDTRGFSQSLSKAESMFNKLQKPIKTLDIAIGNLMANAISRVASSIPAFAQSIVNAAAMVSAEVAQFEATFGDLGETAETVFSGMAADTGIVADRLKTLGTKAFAQFKGAGLEADEAIVEMDRHMRLAADAAAYYDISLEDADERLRSFERGNTEAGDAIGLFTSESQRNSYALERYGKKWLDLTEAQKQMLMLDVAEDIYKQSGAIGQAQRESDNLANVLGNLSSVWQRDVLAVIGAPVESAFTPFVQELTTFLQNETVQTKLAKFGQTLGNIASLAFDGTINLLNSLVSGDGDVSVLFQNIDDAGSNAWSFLNDVWSLLKWLINNQEALNIVVGIIVALFAAMNPSALVYVALAAIIANWEDIKGVIDLAWQAVQDFFSITIPGTFEDMMRTTRERWESIDTWINNAIGSIGNFFSTIVPQAFTDSIQFVSSLFLTVKSNIDSAISALQSFLGIKNKKEPSVNESMLYTGAGVSNVDEGFNFESWAHSVGLLGYATGLTRVPYDNFPALLHRDEAVLTRTQAADWRAGRSGGVDISAIASAVYSAVVAGMSGVSVNMDSQRVGDMVTGRVSQNIAMAAWEGRYA